MTTKVVLTAAIACALTSLTAVAVGQSPGGTTSPGGTNILVLFADDLGWGDVSLHDGVPRTKNIDRLAKEGVELQRYYGYPLCSPSRAALLTGLMPRRFGITYALGPRDEGLPAGLPMLPRILQAANYQTFLVGKWHLGSASPPLASGFDHFYGFMSAEIDYFRHTSRGGAVDWQRNGQTVYDEGYSTFLLAEEAVWLIEERDVHRPFYLHVAFNAPHFPLAAPEEYLAKYQSLRPPTATFAAAVDAMDASIGRILEALDEQGLRNNTLVIFLSDNGADRNGSSLPFSGRKGSVYEGGIRVPCLIRWPGHVTAGTVSQQPTTAQDLFPTLAAAVDVPLNSDLRLDGMNVWPAIRTGLAQDRGPFVIAATDSAIFDGEWKLIETADGTRSLYQIIKDPSETEDLAVEQADIAQRLQAKLAAVKQEFPPLRSRPGLGGRGADRPGIGLGPGLRDEIGAPNDPAGSSRPNESKGTKQPRSPEQ